ncbi:hypothetical protein Tco_1377903 [Tanacetum coccineum]
MLVPASSSDPFSFNNNGVKNSFAHTLSTPIIQNAVARRIAIPLYRPLSFAKRVSSTRKRSRSAIAFPNAYIERQQITAKVAQPVCHNRNVKRRLTATQSNRPVKVGGYPFLRFLIVSGT